jgi:hypothetical protein
MDESVVGLRIPGLRVEYARLRPGEDVVSVTSPHAIGVAFTPQSAAVSDVGTSCRRRAAIPTSAVFMMSSEPLLWRRWDEVSESIEMWMDLADLGRLSRRSGGPSTIVYEPRDLLVDPVIVDIASAFRCAMFTHAALYLISPA